MWLVITALRRPVSIAAILIALVLASISAIRKMPIDIFPTLGIPVIYVAQPYGGLDPAQMEGFISTYYEYHFLYITGIREVESRSIQGVSLIKLVFHHGTNMSQAIAETVSYVDRSRAFMPPGTVPPFVLRFDAGSVPVGDLVFSSRTCTLGDIQDKALFKVRPMFASLPGVSAPPPMGGNQRTVVVHVDPVKLRQYHLSADKVVQAITSGNVISPSGTVRIEDKALITHSNTIVPNIKSLEDIVIEPDRESTVYLRDVGWVENSSDILAGYALVNGKRAVYIPVTKRSDASTWSVVQEVKAALPSMQDAIPDIRLTYEFDQSGYIRNALSGLATEGILGAFLTGLMILLFLRNLRSSLIVVMTIPISLLCAVLALRLLGQTINIMTMAGLALSIGILVDEATVTLENIHVHHASGKSYAQSVVDSAREVSFPLFLVLVSILAVFIPSFFMKGIPGALFMPISLSVGFSMIASYLLSLTMVPIMVIKFLKPSSRHNKSTLFDAFREKYASFLGILFPMRWQIIALYFAGSISLLVILDQVLSIELFPGVDTGQFIMRVRAPTGTRVERTEDITHNVLNTIAARVGEKNMQASLAYVGTQPSSYAISTIYLWTSGPHEAVISVTLRKNSGISLPRLKEELRADIARRFPELSISFEPGDLVGQVTNLGAHTPIEIAIVGKDREDNRRFAEKLKSELSKISEIRDLQYGEATDYPALDINIDRMRAGQLGVTVDQIAKSLVAATSSSRFTSPNYWLDESSGTAYQVQVEVPQASMKSVEDVKAIPAILKPDSSGPFLRDIATVEHGVVMGESHRLNNQRILSLSANMEGDNLKKVSDDVRKAIRNAGETPRGMQILVRSQVSLLLEILDELQVALLIAVIAIFLLLAANFQSFYLAMLSLSTVPAVLAGSGLMLYFTNTSLNIQSYLGSIMAIGVSVANAILLVTFAEHLRKQGADSKSSAIKGAAKRLRPILMTSIAMIAGMLPMALALGEGGEQTAPLGRTVIGGLLASTFATLVLLPLLFAAARKNSAIASVSLDPGDPGSAMHEGERR